MFVVYLKKRLLFTQFPLFQFSVAYRVSPQSLLPTHAWQLTVGIEIFAKQGLSELAVTAWWLSRVCHPQVLPKGVAGRWLSPGPGDLSTKKSGLIWEPPAARGLWLPAPAGCQPRPSYATSPHSSPPAEPQPPWG